MTRIAAALSLVLILGIINWSILEKETQLRDGLTIYLKLTPVDPRSLMQGDYMALRFELENNIRNDIKKTDNKSTDDEFVIVTLDEQNIATFNRIDNLTPLAIDELRLKYRIRNNHVEFATNAFFFQEGHEEVYQCAEYGQFKVDKNGELLLISLYAMDDNELTELAPEGSQTVSANSSSTSRTCR